jgi:hypothetical protein
MSERANISDTVGLTIQELHMAGAFKDGEPLLRIDNHEEAEKAPFRIDAAMGRLHRKNCRAIPESSRSALYSVWKIGKEEQELACPRCKPMPEPEKPKDDPEYPTDLLYGLLSVVNQFGGVLRERGQEYRKSAVGKVLSSQIENMYRGINDRERNILEIVLTSLDQIATTIRKLDENLNNGAANGHDMKNGSSKPERSE